MKNNLQKIRWQNNMTLEKLSQKSGVSKSTLDKIENEALKDIKYSTACKIAKALNVSLIDLFPY